MPGQPKLTFKEHRTILETEDQDVSFSYAGKVQMGQNCGLK